MTRFLGALSCVSMLTLVACGGGGGGGGGGTAKPGKVNTQGAASVVSETSSMQAALKSKDGEGVSGAVISVGIGGAQQIVQPSTTTGALTTIMAALSTPGPNGGTVDCTDTGCVYADFKSGMTTLNGSIKSAVAGDKTTVTTDLTIVTTQTSGQASDVTWKLSGTLDFTATSIDGDLKSTARSTVGTGAQSYSSDYYNEIRYDALVLDATGKATAGDIYAKWTITVGNVAAASQGYDGTVTFPAQ